MALPAQEAMKWDISRSSLGSGWRAFVLCLSFANLCFLSTWTYIQDHENDFFEASAATWTHLAAVTLDVLILAAILWVPVVLAVRSGKRNYVRVLKWCILAGLMIPINSIRTDPYIIRRSGEILQARTGRLALSMVGVALAVFLLIRWEKLSPRLVSAVLMVLLPALPLLILTGAWSIYTGPSGILANRPLLPALPEKPGAPHVLWILFDEWDRALTFDFRPANLHLPNLDRFRGQSLSAAHAYPPARHTIVSVPSLLSGKTFTHSTRQGASELLETYDLGKPPEPLTAEPGIFRTVRSAGFNAGMVGFYLPYCRLFGDFTTCGPAARTNNTSVTLPGLMWVTARDQFRGFPLMVRLGFAQRSATREETHLNAYLRLHREAIQTVRDPRLNFVFLHYLVPHGPVIYDAAKASVSDGPDGTYLDNLALVDRTLGEIRQTMEQAGTWDSTSILLTSDHPLRVNQWQGDHQVHGRLAANVHQGTRVPFLLKMAGEKQGVEYKKAIQTVVTKDLLLEVLNRHLTTAEQVAAWLDTHPPRQ